MRSNKGFSLFELILVIFISSILLIFTSSFTKELYTNQIENEKIAMLKIDLNSTKIIIEKNLPNILGKLKYNNDNLYINNHLLLKNVSNFKMSNNTQKVFINITLEDKIKQRWEFVL